MVEKKPASKILRVLLLDDSPDDAEQASMALRAAGFMLKTQRLETGVAVEQNLESNPWDLILCAHGVANLPARQVVELAFYGELTQVEIAERTGTPLGTVKSRVRLGLLAMRRTGSYSWKILESVLSGRIIRARRRRAPGGTQTRTSALRAWLGT